MARTLCATKGENNSGGGETADTTVHGHRGNNSKRPRGSDVRGILAELCNEVTSERLGGGLQHDVASRESTYNRPDERPSAVGSTPTTNGASSSPGDFITLGGVHAAMVNLGNTKARR